MTTQAKLKSEMRAGVDAVIAGDKKKFKATGICPAMVADYLEGIGWEKSNLETNGWQYDWWLTFIKGEDSFTAFGCGYEGDFEFSRTEES